MKIFSYMNAVKKVICRNIRVNMKCIEISARFPKVEISPQSRFIIEDLDRLSIGENAHIGDFTVIYVGKKEHDKSVCLTIGESTYIGEMNNIRAASASIYIGDRCLLAQGITIVSSNHGIDGKDAIRSQAWVGKDVVINDDVWIGANSVILPGVKIGKGAVIGAGSIVTKDIPDYQIAVGNPACCIRERM